MHQRQRATALPPLHALGGIPLPCAALAGTGGADDGSRLLASFRRSERCAQPCMSSPSIPAVTLGRQMLLSPFPDEEVVELKSPGGLFWCCLSMKQSFLYEGTGLCGADCRWERCTQRVGSRTPHSASSLHQGLGPLPPQMLPPPK